MEAIKGWKSTTLICAALLMGCAPSLQELWLEKDGSGSMEITIDLAEFMDMVDPMISAMVGDTLGDEVSTSDAFTGEQFDTMANFYDVVPDSIKERMDNPEILKKMTIHMIVDSIAQLATMKLGLEFENQNQLAEIVRALMESEKGSNDPMSMLSAEDLIGMFPQYALDNKAGTITIPPVKIDKSLIEGTELEKQVSKLDSLDTNSEDLAFLRMLIGDRYKLIVHAPGKIKKVSRDEAKVDGKTVMLEVDMIEELKNIDSRKEFVIKYKK